MPPVSGDAGRIFKEKRDGHIQDGRNRLKTACADPVCAFFVFLNLLEGDAKGFAELFLAHSEHVAAQPHSASDMNIDRIRFFFVFDHFFLCAAVRLF